MATAAPAEAASRPGRAVLSLTSRRAVRSGALWGYVFGIFVASSALGFAATYRTAAARARLAATFANNAGIDALIGRAHDVATVAGFTAWRSLGILGLVGAVWGVLTATRLLRGEEEAGRWELLLVGRATRGAAAAQALGGLGSGAAVLFALTAAITVVVGRSSQVHLGAAGALFLALVLVAPAVFFLAVGALTSQLGATRRRAATYGGVVIGASFLLRLIADSSTGLGWLRWSTPLGWAENAEAVAHPSPLALLPLGVGALGLGALAVVLAGRRDLGASVIAQADTAPTRTRLLGGPGRFAIRLARPSVTGWLAAIGAVSFVMGFIAKPASTAITASRAARSALFRLGGAGAGANLFLSATLLVVSMLVALMAAAEVAAARATEADGQLDNLLVRPVRRLGWLGGSAGVVALAVLAGAVVVALGTWLGGACEHAGLSPVSLLRASLSLAVPALLVLGSGLLCLGVWPRATTVFVYTLVSWSLLVDFIGSLAGLNHWLLDTSLLHQVAGPPATPVHWAADGVMVGIALAVAGLGAAVFSRRDLVGA